MMFFNKLLMMMVGLLVLIIMVLKLPKLVPGACSLTTMISVVKPTLHTPLMQTPLMASASKAMALALTIPSLKTSLVL